MASPPSLSLSPVTVIFRDPLSPQSSPNSLPNSPYFPTSPFSPRISQNPFTLMERRNRLNPTVSVSGFHTSSQSYTATEKEKSPPLIRPPATLYDVLQIPQTASETEIKTAYRRLARLYHPDVVPLQQKDDSTKTFLQIHAAYVGLSDPKSRARYDLQLSIQALQSPTSKVNFSKAGDAKTPQPSPIRTSTSYCSPRSAYSVGRGRSWETDQCWC